jgi:hypothetical protein
MRKGQSKLNGARTHSSLGPDEVPNANGHPFGGFIGSVIGYHLG